MSEKGKNSENSTYLKKNVAYRKFLEKGGGTQKSDFGVGEK